MTTTAATDFLIRRDDLHSTEFAAAPDPASVKLEPGQVLLAVDSFAFTANNVTYAVFGDAMRYWAFFPAREGWGTVPVWGFAVVERSAHPDVAAGERIFGYLPMSTHFVANAGNVTPGGFVEAAPHRSELAAIYNQYVRCAADPGYDAKHEAEQMLFRVLFLTGWLIDDFLAEADFFGAKSVVVSSASSKTSIGLAFCLSQHGRDKCEVVGLTSPANKAFVEGLGCYHRVVTYDEIESLPVTPSVFVDMAGDAKVTSAVHHHFGEALRYSCSVGGTHWENLAFGHEFPGPTPTLFFAPSQVDKRTADWGAAGLQQRMSQGWLSFLPRVHGWISVERASGNDAIERVYKDTLEGRADPKKGYVLSF
ncbi:MAG: DUF2855 family protein [Candidatus Binatia bacterium]